MVGLGLWIWFGSITIGTLMASQRNNPIGGFVLCLFFGPLGVFGCAFIEARIRCPQCGTPLNENPHQCPSCWSWFRWNSTKTKCEWIPYEFRRNEPTQKPKKLSDPVLGAHVDSEG